MRSYLMTIALMMFVFNCAKTGQQSSPTSTELDTGMVYAEIGNKKITESDIQAKLEEVPPYARAEYESESGKRELVERMLEEEAVFLAAKEAGYENNKEILDELNKRKKTLMMQYYYRDVIQGRLGLDEKVMQDYYAAHKAEFADPSQIKIRQILLSDSMIADSIKKIIDVKPESFGEIAREISLDTGTKASGGYLGYAIEGQEIPILGNVPALSDALFNQPINTIFGPYKMDDGWHLFVIDEKQQRKEKEFKDVLMQVRDRLIISDKDIEAYFNEHKDEFTEGEKVKVRHIFAATQATIQKAYNRVKKGEDFEKVAREVSEDSATKDAGGLIGFIEHERYIRSVGRSKEFEDAAFALEPGQYSDIVKTEKGYHIISSVEKISQKVKALEEVADQIRSKLLANIENEKIDQAFAQLKEKYGAKIIEAKVTETEDELFEKAQQSTDPKEQLGLYQKLLRGYPEGKYACDAQFMIGFIFAEHLKDTAQAKAALTKLITEWPDCSWVDDAKWMLDDLETGKRTKELMDKLDNIEKGDPK